MNERGGFWSGIAIISGTIFGVGVFGIPYAVAKSGPVMGLFWFIILALAVTFLHLLYGSLQTGANEHKRLISLVGHNLGNRWRGIPFISTVIGGVGAMLAYILVGGEFLKTFFYDIFGGTSEGWGIILWLFLSVFVLLGIKSVAKFELIASIILFLGVGLLVYIFWQKASLSLIPRGTTDNFFVPYGIILFSLYGANAIPEAVEFLGGDKKRIAKAIILGTLIPLVSYVIFTFAVLGLNGNNVTQDAISGLSSLFNPIIIKLAVIVGFLAIATSFVTVGLYLSNTLTDDLNLPYLPAKIITVCAPMVVFFLGLRSFSLIAGVVGAILGGIDGILIAFIFMKLRAKGKVSPLVYIPTVIPILLIVIFSIGIIGEITTIIIGR